MGDRTWKWTALLLPIAYCLAYAPYGINETDGGFLTGLGWQILQDGTLYADVVYVRPPLPVWLRSIELFLLPDTWAVLGERVIFYVKLAIYSHLAADILAKGRLKWQLSAFGFVLSAHNYPPTAWHTTDGILFAVLAVWLALRAGRGGGFAGGMSLVAALLCKQSFYPLAFFFPIFIAFHGGFHAKRLFWGLMGMFAGAAIFAAYLFKNNLVAAYFRYTSGAASGGQALQHGLLDYFRITPELLLPTLALLALTAWAWPRRPAWRRVLAWAGAAWFVALPLSFVAITLLRQEHLAPFAQSRLLFWGAAWVAWMAFRRRDLRMAVLLGIGWCASISWGYNLPLLFATPLAHVGFWYFGEIKTCFPERKWHAWAFLLLLLVCFFAGHWHGYRDGARAELREDMGGIFPSLTGIRSDAQTAALYRELRSFQEKYGPNYAVLPSFPQAHFLGKTAPTLPLGWVVNRETNGDNFMIFRTLEDKKPIIFLEKSYTRARIEQDPELAVTRWVLTHGKVLEEGAFFWVLRM